MTMLLHFVYVTFCALFYFALPDVTHPCAYFSCRLGLSYNEISTVENGSIANVPHLRELHLDNNALTSVPPGLSEHKYIQVHTGSKIIGIFECQNVTNVVLIAQIALRFLLKSAHHEKWSHEKNDTWLV